MASDPFTGSGAYVSGSGGVEASRFTGNCEITILMLSSHKAIIFKPLILKSL